MEKPRRLLLLVIAVAALLVVASVLLGIDRSGPEENPAAELLPDLSGYNTVEGESLTDYISKLSEGAALLAGQPELALAIAAVDQVIGCYQEVGAVEARVYAVEDDPLSAGVVAVGDRNKLLPVFGADVCRIYNSKLSVFQALRGNMMKHFESLRGDFLIVLII